MPDVYSLKLIANSFRLTARGWFSLVSLVPALNFQPELSVRKLDQLLVPVDAFVMSGIICRTKSLSSKGYPFLRWNSAMNCTSAGIGCIVDGCPPGLSLTEADIQADLDRRKRRKTVILGEHPHAGAKG